MIQGQAARLANHLDRGTLTKREYEAIHLHDVKGLSYRQIGLALGLSWGTVRDRVARARQKIALAERIGV